MLVINLGNTASKLGLSATGEAKSYTTIRDLLTNEQLANSFRLESLEVRLLEIR